MRVSPTLLMDPASTGMTRSPIGVCSGHACIADPAGPDIDDIARTLGMKPAHLLRECECLLQIERGRSRARFIDCFLDGTAIVIHARGWTRANPSARTTITRSEPGRHLT